MSKGMKGKKITQPDRSNEHPHGKKATAAARHSYSKMVHKNHSQKMSEC
jgi:hypothetical protein